MFHGRTNLSQPASYPSASRLLRRVTLLWTADANGPANGEFTPTQNGELVRVVAIPGKGKERPRAGYRIALVNCGGIDVLGSRGRDQPSDRLIDLGPVGFIHDPLELRVSAAGPEANGRVVLYVRNGDR